MADASPVVAPGKQRIVRIDRSPMNDLIWVIQLACGHDVCVTQKKRPAYMRTFTDKTTGERMTSIRLLACSKCKEKAHV